MERLSGNSKAILKAEGSVNTMSTIENKMGLESDWMIYSEMKAEKNN